MWGYNSGMRKQRTLFLLGIWTIALPYLGFPIFFKNLLFVLTGLLVSFIAYRWYEETKSVQMKKDEETTTWQPDEKHWPKTIHEEKPESITPLRPVHIRPMNEVKLREPRRAPTRRKTGDIMPPASFSEKTSPIQSTSDPITPN